MASLEQVLNAFDLEQATGDDDTFTADSLYIPTKRVFGGQFLAQSVVAAAKTTSEYRLPSSLHAYFLKPGLLDETLSYEVGRLQDGVTFSHREVSAYQTHSNGRPVFKAMVSFHERESSPVDFSAAKMPPTPDPKEVATFTQTFEKYSKTSEWARYFASSMPFEVRQISPSLFLGEDPAGENARELAWVRVRPEDARLLQTIPKASGLNEQLLGRALLTFVSDQFAFSPALRKGGLSWLAKGSKYVSLDHAQYFHRDVDLTRWNLIAGDSPAAANSRGLGVTHVFTEDGETVSTFTQEGLIRVSSAV
jgi:acyl-CoA thioesterase-2